MSDRLKGKTAFVTAAGQGIGPATALTFARDGAQVIATDTNAELLQALTRSSGQSLQQVEAMFVERQPMGRLGTADEIAAMAVYLASDESSFTTGTAMLVDGGWTL